MTTILLSGWKVGFEKVKFIRLLQESLNYSLSEAKGMTDRLLDRGTVTLQVPEAEVEGLLLSMNKLGAKCAAAVAAN